MSRAHPPGARDVAPSPGPDRESSMRDGGCGVRIYLPSTMSGLRRSLEAGAVAVRSGVGFAVTGPLRGEYPDWSEEDLEYLAMQDASRASLRLIGGSDDGEPALRVVIAADVDDANVTPRPEADP